MTTNKIEKLRKELAKKLVNKCFYFNEVSSLGNKVHNKSIKELSFELYGKSY
jgi:Leucine-rich repeat (LRR) protein|tara:strand:+ start:376 stop:531 length:156 start_codon:yes stop_codon:yes gene_type:complete